MVGKWAATKAGKTVASLAALWGVNWVDQRAAWKAESWVVHSEHWLAELKAARTAVRKARKKAEPMADRMVEP